VPANASSAQRFLTLDAFAQAGFEVMALLNEPSAAGFEYAHRYRSTITAKREHVLIYDLGGGTFDASLLKMTGRFNEVVISEGIQRLGGDDFDEAILKLVRKGARLRKLDAGTRDLLLEECAVRKEAVSPNTRRFLVDLTAVGKPRFPARSTTSTRPVRRWWTRLLRPSPACCTTRPATTSTGPRWRASMWSAGPGASRLLPGRCARCSTRNASNAHCTRLRRRAIGLAVFLDKEAGFVLSERLSRHFGVFREACAGEDVCFDPIVPKGAQVPTAASRPSW